MNNMQIRVMTIDDYEAVHALWMTIHGFSIRSIDDSEEGVRQFLQRNPGLSVVAVNSDDEVVGAILCGHDGRRGFIQHACVSPDFRRRGIGRKLVHRALAALKAEQITKVALVAFKKNEGGNAFWAEEGFTLRDDLNYRNLALVDLIRYDPDYVR